IDLALGRDEQWYHIRKLVSNAFTKTKLRSVSTVMEEQIDNLIRRMNQFEKNNQPSPRDLLDHLIIDSKGQDKDSVAMVGNDFIVAGSETNASTLELLLMFLINYPKSRRRWPVN
ncbi:hypothetical protein SAMD00019534_123160, partial [Acytostelium subglobosum LB1]|uniref:hypothetical protein n=1 Tax=Acytostelium subglobosum LB1 TaxID=1410327 RepID=UPI0006448FE5